MQTKLYRVLAAVKAPWLDKPNEFVDWYHAGSEVQALELVRFLMGKGAPWYLENLVGCISTRIRKPDQIIQPYHM